MTDYPIIESSELILQFPTQNDVDNLFEIYGDSESMSMFCLESINKAQIAELIIKKNKNFDNLTELYFGVYLGSTKELIGYIDLHYMNFAWNLEYCINSRFRNKGYAYKAIILAIQFCRESGVKEIIAIVKNSNLISIYLLNKIGFVVYNADIFIFDNKINKTVPATNFRLRL